MKNLSKKEGAAIMANTQPIQETRDGINSIVSQVRVGISKHLLDRHFTVLWANDYVYELTGYTKSGFQTRFHNHVDEYYGENKKIIDYIEKEIWKAYENQEKGYELDCPMRIKRGRTNWVHVSGSFSKESYRGVPVMYNVFFDITALKNRQLDLEKQTAQLNEMLEAELKGKKIFGEMLSLISPNIRTAANLITGMTDIARVSLEDKARVEECLEKIGDAVFELRKIVAMINNAGIK